MERIRRNYPRIEYFAALELTVKGTPHLHILTRGSYISQRWLSAAWRNITGSYIVHIQKVDNVQGALDEVVKYLVKTAARIQAVAPRIPVLTMSRGWLPPDFHTRSDPPDPATFRGFFSVGSSAFTELLDRLGGSLSRAVGGVGRWRLDFPQPPPWEEVWTIVQCNSKALGRLALCLWSHFTQGDPDWVPYDHLECEFYGTPAPEIDYSLFDLPPLPVGAPT